LLAGGDVKPIAPVGPGFEVVAAVAPDPAVYDDRVDALRASAARALVATDGAPPFGGSEWLLLGALNDLLQCANPSLGLWGRRRVERLLDEADRLTASAGPPKTVRQALSRYATFRRIAAARRVDTRVAWWSGARTWIGSAPPSRVLSWSAIRRVNVERSSVSFLDMGPEAESEAFRRVASRWLAADPLTDVMTFGAWRRPAVWSGALAMLVAVPEGQRMFVRAVLRAGPEARAALERAVRSIPAEHVEDRHRAQRALSDVNALSHACGS
jgi:hypothetical protein